MLSDPSVSPDARLELMRRLRSGSEVGLRADPGHIYRRAPDVVPPMSEEQQHIWLHASRTPQQPLYNEAITVHLHGPFNHTLFLRSFNIFLQRHEAWRTSFDFQEEVPRQVIHRDLDADFPVVDLASLPSEQAEAQAVALASSDARLPFDLTQAPLFRGRILRMSETEHRLYLTLHHIIFDGVSIYRIFMPELSEIYRATMADSEPVLPPVKVQYGDYAVWQAKRSQTDAYDRQIAHWRAALSGDLPILQLPFDRSPAAVPSGRGAMETFSLDEMLVRGLKNLGRDHNCTLYMTLLAAFKVLLHRYSGQEDLVIGGVTDTRRRHDLENMLGYCLNALPLRSRPKPDLSFVGFMAQVRNVVVTALENSDVPFGRLVRSLHVRSSSHPIFEVLFSVEPPAPAFAPGWDLTQMDVPLQSSKYQLYLELDERPDGSMAARFMYSSDLFDRETIVRMVHHWKTLLADAVASPEATLDDLAWFAPGEEELVASLAKGRDLPCRAVTLDALVRETARYRPDALAIAFGDQSIRYTELIARVDALAGRLRAVGVGRGDLVALCLDRSETVIIGALAILQRGAGYLPLDPTFPQAKLSKLVEAAEPSVILTQQRLRDRLPSWGKIVVAWDDGIVATAAPSSLSRPDDIAYVMYTSGSTGVPKGVNISHRSLINLLLSMQYQPGFKRQDILLAVTTPTFDISVLEMFLPLITGGTVVMARAEEIADPALLASAISRSKCTVMQATPATWTGLFASGWAGVPGLRVLCGGEALPPDLAQHILDAGMELWNMYGPTEATIWSSVARVGTSARISIGRPVDNSTIHILDRRGRRQPFNVAGELHIGGAGLALGYRDAEQTRRAFWNSPLVDGARLYRSGDIALMRADGALEWLGRADGQVKVRGYRIELGEIEAALNAHSSVAMSAVRTFDDPSGQKALAAYIVGAGEAPPDEAQLRAFLRATLAPYMLPARYVVVASLPLSFNGKIDRTALPAPPPLRATTPAAMPALPALPASEQETRLLAVWREVLEVEHLDLDDDFYDAGGHSLLAAHLMARVERTLGIRFALSVLLRAPTPRLMAALLASGDEPHAAPTIIPIQEGSLRPLFWVDAVPTLRPGRFRAFARALGRQRPVLGVTTSLERQDHIDSVESLARSVTEAIMRHPSGPPYLIGGWCNGGILAYEVASQLLQRGRSIGLLVLLDTANPEAFRRRVTRIFAQATQILTLPQGKRLAFATETAAGYFSRFRRRHMAESNEADELLNLNERFTRLINAYSPRALAAPVALFQPHEGKIDYAAGWSSVLGSQLSAVDVQGGHVSVLEDPDVADLATEISKRLERI